MKSLQRPFKFPKKLWLAFSVVAFLYLFLTVAVTYKDDQPTAWNALLNGELEMGMLFGLFWLIIALVFGALVAAVLGIFRAFFRS